MEKNFKEFDYQTIVVKKEKAEEIINNYKCFGWNLEISSQHTQYENLIEVEFSRPHKINKKDDLQFLQVNMETNIIAQGRLDKFKHLKSATYGSILLIFGLICLVNSILAFLHMKPMNALIVGLIFAAASLASFILVLCFLKKIINKERQIYNAKTKEYSAAINSICNKAEEIRGEENGKNEY